MEGFRTLRQGSRVTYDLIQGPKGDLAQNIRSLDIAVQEESAATEVVAQAA